MVSYDHFKYDDEQTRSIDLDSEYYCDIVSNTVHTRLTSSEKDYQNGKVYKKRSDILTRGKKQTYLKRSEHVDETICDTDPTAERKHTYDGICDEPCDSIGDKKRTDFHHRNSLINSTFWDIESFGETGEKTINEQYSLGNN